MNGKSKITVLTTLAVGVLCALAAVPQNGQAPRRTAELEGGVVVRKSPGRIVRVVMAQNRLPSSAVVPVIQQMQGLLDKEFELGQIPPRESAIETVKAVTRLPDTGVAFVLLEDMALPTVLVAPEDGWAAINVAALAKDSPDTGLLTSRVCKELWRAMVWTLSESYERNCVMRHATNLKELDAITVPVPSPDPMFRLVNGAGKRGLRTIMRATYREACEDGWAPPPTNDIQRTIYEQVKADKERGPTNPITIPPPNTKR